MSNIVPLAIPHSAVRDFHVTNKKTEETFFIPKGTQVLSVLGSIMNDENVFPDPKTFRPERFLGPSGEFKPHPHVSRILFCFQAFDWSIHSQLVKKCIGM